MPKRKCCDAARRDGKKGTNVRTMMGLNIINYGMTETWLREWRQ